MSANNPAEKDERPVYVLIQQIKDGSLNPETLTKELRQCCVEVLLSEAYSVVSMAQVLKKSEKTIKRDIEEIRERNALSPDLDLAKRIVGELVMYARINRDHLMKLARTKDASVSEKAQAEYLAFKVISEMFGRLRETGYLPSCPQKLVGDFFHHIGEEGTALDDIDRQIIELGNVAQGDDETSRLIRRDMDNMKKLVDQIKAQKEPDVKEQNNEQTQHE
mgnify:CR=1 FL=1